MCKKCVDIMLPVSKADDWEEAQIEWKHKKSQYGIDTYCICGVKIKNRFWLFNKTQDVGFWVGSVCVNNIFEVNSTLKKSVHNYHCFLCNTCVKLSSRCAHRKSKKHLANKEKFKDFKKCEKCQEYKVCKFTNYKKCIECYTGKKKCLSCGKYKIRGNYKKCFDCHMN